MTFRTRDVGLVTRESLVCQASPGIGGSCVNRGLWQLLLQTCLAVPSMSAVAGEGARRAIVDRWPSLAMGIAVDDDTRRLLGRACRRVFGVAWALVATDRSGSGSSSSSSSRCTARLLGEAIICAHRDRTPLLVTGYLPCRDFVIIDRRDASRQEWQPTTESTVLRVMVKVRLLPMPELSLPDEPDVCVDVGKALEVAVSVLIATVDRTVLDSGAGRDVSEPGTTDEVEMGELFLEDEETEAGEDQ
jgi:hypothetical protein